LSDPSYVTLVAEFAQGVVAFAGATLSRYFEKDGAYARLGIPPPHHVFHGRIRRIRRHAKTRMSENPPGI